MSESNQPPKRGRVIFVQLKEAVVLNGKTLNMLTHKELKDMEVAWDNAGLTVFPKRGGQALIPANNVLAVHFEDGTGIIPISNVKILWLKEEPE